MGFIDFFENIPFSNSEHITPTTEDGRIAIKRTIRKNSSLPSSITEIFIPELLIKKTSGVLTAETINPFFLDQYKI